jgi:hypothetical protein
MNRKEIVNKYIYLINQLFIGKEVIVYYDWEKSHHEQKTYSLWMGLENYDISLPDNIDELIFKSGLFVQESGSKNQDTYVLKDISELKEWINFQLINYNIKDIDTEIFEPAIKKLRRINNLDKLLYNQ